MAREKKESLNGVVDNPGSASPQRDFDGREVAFTDDDDDDVDDDDDDVGI